MMSDPSQPGYVSPLHRPVLFKRLSQMMKVMTTKQLFDLVECADAILKKKEGE